MPYHATMQMPPGQGIPTFAANELFVREDNGTVLVSNGVVETPITRPNVVVGGS
jgi:hypothetical protein